MTKPVALIIEDDNNQSMIFSKALEFAGCQTEVIQDGHHALKRLNSTAPDLVLLDLHLPHIAGKELLSHIRREEHLRHTKVILATADALLADSLRKQAQLVLVKPISFSQLRDLTKRLLSAKPVR